MPSFQSLLNGILLSPKLKQKRFPVLASCVCQCRWGCLPVRVGQGVLPLPHRAKVQLTSLQGLNLCSSNPLHFQFQMPWCLNCSKLCKSAEDTTPWVRLYLAPALWLSTTREGLEGVLGPEHIPLLSQNQAFRIEGP